MTKGQFDYISALYACANNQTEKEENMNLSDLIEENLKQKEWQEEWNELEKSRTIEDYLSDYEWDKE